jgi:hypothetical protein
MNGIGYELFAVSVVTSYTFIATNANTNVIVKNTSIEESIVSDQNAGKFTRATTTVKENSQTSAHTNDHSSDVPNSNLDASENDEDPKTPDGNRQNAQKDPVWHFFFFFFFFFYSTFFFTATLVDI